MSIISMFVFFMYVGCSSPTHVNSYSPSFAIRAILLHALHPQLQLLYMLSGQANCLFIVSDIDAYGILIS